MMRRSFISLMAVSALNALLTIAPPTAHAIPTAGDYVFTSGLTGTFTSTGSSLSAWQITDPSGNPYNSLTDTVVDNSPVLFAVKTGPDFPFLQLEWDISGLGNHAFQYVLDSGFASGSLPMTFQAVSSSSVPEPSAVVLLGIGLLALVGYVRRQRHHAELQVG